MMAWCMRAVRGAAAGMTPERGRARPIVRLLPVGLPADLATICTCRSHT